MKSLIFTVSALTLLNITIAAKATHRMLANGENSDQIQLNPKQWGIIAGGGILVFGLTYLLLGLCCKFEPRTREQSSTLTSALTSDMSEMQETERPLEEVPEEVEEEPEEEYEPEPGKNFQKTKIDFLEPEPVEEEEPADDDSSSGEDVEVIIKKRKEIVKDEDGNEVEKEIVSHVIIFPDGTEEERPGMPGEEFEEVSDEEEGDDE